MQLYSVSSPILRGRRQCLAKLVLRLTVLIGLWSLLQPAIRAQRIVYDSVKVCGYLRHYYMYLPDGLQENAPLVFALHGYGSRGDVNTWMNEAAKRHGFALCVPVGLPDPKGNCSWNVGYPFQAGWKVNDVETMCRLAAHVQKKYRLSKDRTYLTGMSNGGEMCYLLAYSKQTTFKALASLAGLTLVWMYNELEAPRSIPFLEIHGTEDRTSEWTGDLTNAGGWGAYLPVDIAIGYLVARNRCQEGQVSVEQGKTNQGQSRTIVKTRYINPTTHHDVWLYKIVGAPHCWFTDDIDTGEEVWKFFQQYN